LSLLFIVAFHCDERQGLLYAKLTRCERPPIWIWRLLMLVMVWRLSAMQWKEQGKAGGHSMRIGKDWKSGFLRFHLAWTALAGQTSGSVEGTGKTKLR